LAKNDNGIANELEAILDSYDNIKAQKQDAAVDDERRQEFLAKFERIKVDVIKPAMEEIGEYLEKKGHSSRIEDNVSVFYDDTPVIRMDIYPKILTGEHLHAHEFPTIAFIGEPDIEAVGIEIQDGMPRRPGLTRSYTTTLDSFTKEYVKSQIVAVVKSNFAKTLRKHSNTERKSPEAFQWFGLVHKRVLTSDLEDAGEVYMAEDKELTVRQGIAHVFLLPTSYIEKIAAKTVLLKLTLDELYHFAAK
jgi:hypothetical protein